MKGITPVIAIILLLLMAVAAAGGFYFVYQGFTESGEESGSTQIEQLGETSLAALQIESAAGGRIYVKNVGASDVDLSKATVYVENVPYNVNASSDTLAERSRAVLKFTQRPSCASDECEVKISGAASTSKRIELSKLSCASSADCYSGETCDGGVCVEEGEPSGCGDGTCDESEDYDSCPADCEGECGDGICDPTEDGVSCFTDCSPRSLLLFNLDPVGVDADVYAYDWNGSTYVQGENVSQSSDNNFHFFSEFDSEGNALSIGGIDPGDVEGFAWSRWDGSWSTPQRFTSPEWGNNENSDWDFNSSDEALAVWTTGLDYEALGWSSFDGSMSTPQNLTSNDGLQIYSVSFAFAPWDDGMAVWQSSVEGMPPQDRWINYTLWQGGWGESGTVLSLEDGLSYYINDLAVGFNSTHAMAVWILDYDYLSDPTEVLQWSTWDNSSWSEPQNFSDTRSEFGALFLETYDDGWVLAFMNQTGDPAWPEWASWQDGWTLRGNLTDDDWSSADGTCFLQNNQNGALMHISGPSTPENMFYKFSRWNGAGWEEPVLMG